MTYRWNPYVLLTGQDLLDCFKTHFIKGQKVLMIMSRGFDVRMNVALQRLLEHAPEIDIYCLVIEFDEGEGSSSIEYLPQVEANMSELRTLVPNTNIEVKHIELWQSDGNSKKRRVGDRNAAKIIDEIRLAKFADIIVDISALPRGIYFSMIGKLLALIDNLPLPRPNLMITVAENAELDKSVKDERPDDEPNLLLGFNGRIGQTSASNDEPLIWMPILGEDKEDSIKKAHTFLAPQETCPIFPFPSRDPRRPDALMIKYHGLLFDEFTVEEQNVMYVPEQNPFEAYKILLKAINNYRKSLSPIGNCNIVLSTFSSKLLSIGTLLAAYELKSNNIEVAVLNVDSHGYKLHAGIDLNKMKKESNLFLIWLTGTAYEK